VNGVIVGLGPALRAAAKTFRDALAAKGDADSGDESRWVPVDLGNLGRYVGRRARFWDLSCNPHEGRIAAVGEPDCSAWVLVRFEGERAWHPAVKFGEVWM
jgi:hypothetical protein